MTTYDLIMVDGSGPKCSGQYKTEERAREVGELMSRQHQGKPLCIEVREGNGVTTLAKVIPWE